MHHWDFTRFRQLPADETSMFVVVVVVVTVVINYIIRSSGFLDEVRGIL